MELFQNSPVALFEKDVSETKEMLNVLVEQHKDKLEDYLDSHPEVIEELSQKIKLKKVNEKAIELFGAKSEEEVIQSFNNTFTTETYQSNKKELIALALKYDFENESYISDFYGNIIPVYITIRYSRSNDFSSVVVTLIDLRIKIEYHKNILEVSKKYQNLIELTGTAFIILNDEYDIVDSNERFRNILGLHDELSIIGKNPRSWIDKSSLDTFDLAIEKIEQGLSPQNIEILLTGKAGNNLLVSRSVWLNLIMSKVETGQKIIFCLVQDISHKKLEEMKKFIAEQRRKDLFKQNIGKIRDKIGDIGEGNNSD